MRLFDQYFLQIPILVLCLLTGMINQANAEEILRLSDQKSDYPLAQYLTILEDPGGKLTLSEVTQPEMVKHFRKNREAGLNLGYSSRTFWLRLTVINRSNTDKRWLIQQNHTHTQLMEVYNQANNYRVQRSGTLVPLALRDVEQREITFTTKLPRNKEQTIYLRLQSHGAISLDINLLTQQAFINKKSKTIFVLGLFYGFLLIIAIYNLFFLLSLKELSHLYLVLFVFFFGAVYSLYDGFGQLFFNNAILSFAPYLMPILMGLTSITLLLHRNAFLSIDHPAGNDKFLLLGWLLLISATPFINLTYVMKATILLMLLTAAYIFVTTARCWHTQGSAVKFAVLGWAIFCGFIFLLGLARLNILPDYFIFEQFTRVGLIALVLLLSIALVDRMNKLKLNSDQVNAALIKAETHRNLALEAAQLGIWRWEIASDRIDWSDRTCQIFGVTPDNVPESFERYRTFIHPDDFDYLEKTVEEAIANHSPYSLQHRIIRKNGKEAWLQCYGKIELDEENNLLGITGTVQDISGQKQLEVEKKQSRQLYEAIFSSATEGFAICSFDGKILEANPAICDLYRYDKDTFLSLDPSQLTHPDSAREFKTYLRTIKNEKTCFGEITQRRKDGEPIDVEFHSSQIDYQGTPHIFFIVHDIRERKRIQNELSAHKTQLEAAVKNRTKELESVNRELESFSYSVSHDLRSPLRAIDGYSKLLLEDCKDKLDEDENTLLLRIRENTARMGRLINHLLDLSRLSRTDLTFVNLDLHQIAEEIIDELEQNEPERQIDFLCSVTHTAYADAELARIALVNLLQNAWKYTSKVEHPVIEFGEYSNNEQIIYFVKDNGVGFDMAYADKLFSAFNRLHGREYEGSGIGLATVQRIVQRHQGEIWVEAEPGKGATFFFTFNLDPRNTTKAIGVIRA